MIHVVYCSPAGTTRAVGKAIADEAENQGVVVQTWDLSQQQEELSGLALKSGDCLFVGSPVYTQHALPGVMDFIHGLNAEEGAVAAAYVTYGLVSSGVALSDMAQALTDKGVGILGGIKIPAIHSLLKESEAPLGKDRPNAQDLDQARAFARSVLDRARADSPASLAVAAFEQPIAAIREAALSSSIDNLKGMLPPMEIDSEACTECGLCQDNCPTSNITLEPYPVLGDKCILCFNCVTVCNDEAIKNPALAFMEPEILKRRELFQEPPEVRVITE